MQVKILLFQTKKKKLISAIFVTIIFFTFLWLNIRVNIFPGRFSGLRLDCVEIMPHCSCYLAWSLCHCIRTEFCQSSGFLLTLLSSFVKIKSYQCIEQCKSCLPNPGRDSFGTQVLTFIFQITKVCSCISVLNNCGIHVYENEVIMRATFH